MRDLVLWLARELVERKDAVQVEAIERDRSTILELSVAPEDLGRVIGRGGRTAKALRTVLDFAARRDGRHSPAGARGRFDCRACMRTAPDRSPRMDGRTVRPALQRAGGDVPRSVRWRVRTPVRGSGPRARAWCPGTCAAMTAGRWVRTQLHAGSRARRESGLPGWTRSAERRSRALADCNARPADRSRRTGFRAPPGREPAGRRRKRGRRRLRRPRAHARGRATPGWGAARPRPRRRLRGSRPSVVPPAIG